LRTLIPYGSNIKSVTKKYVSNLFFHRNLRKNRMGITHYYSVKITFSLMRDKNVCIIILDLILWKVRDIGQFS
jgi:hypothetical protein